MQEDQKMKKQFKKRTKFLLSYLKLRQAFYAFKETEFEKSGVWFFSDVLIRKQNLKNLDTKKPKIWLLSEAEDKTNFYYSLFHALFPTHFLVLLLSASYPLSKLSFSYLSFIQILSQKFILNLAFQLELISIQISIWPLKIAKHLKIDKFLLEMHWWMCTRDSSKNNGKHTHKR